MSDVKQDPEFIIASLLEANEILRSEVQRLTVSRSTLRRINGALRESITSMQRQIAIAQENDELFKDLCAGKFDAPGQFDAKVTETNGALPTVGTVVEPLI